MNGFRRAVPDLLRPMARDEVAGRELAQLGVLLEAGLCCVRAARSEAAAGLRVDGRGDLAAQNGALGRVVDIDARNGRKKRWIT